jgi:hypothetical protein
MKSLTYVRYTKEVEQVQVTKNAGVITNVDNPSDKADLTLLNGKPPIGLLIKMDSKNAQLKTVSIDGSLWKRQPNSSTDVFNRTKRYLN